MKKRILSGLLLTATVAAGFSTFTSCKDTDEDLRTEFTSQQLSLETALAKLKSTVDDIKSCACTPHPEFPKMTVDELNTLLQQNPNPAKTTIESWIASEINKLNLFGENGSITEINTDIDKLETLLKNVGLEGLTPEQAGAFATLVPKAQQIVQFIENYQPVTPGTPYDDTDLQNKVSTLRTDVNNLTDLINGNEEKGIKGLLKEVADMQSDISGIKGDVSDIKGDITSIKSDVSSNKTNIENLQLWFKDINLTVPEFQEYVKQGEWVKNNKESMETLYAYIYGDVEKGIEGKKDLIDKLNGEALDALNTYFGDLDQLSEISKLKKMYDTLFPDDIAEETEWWSYEIVMTNIKENQAAIKALQEDMEKVLDILDNMVTSLVLQTTTNPLFGSINTPFGINSMVLMSYYGKLTTGLESFPASNQSTEYCGFNVDPEINSINWAAMLKDANSTSYNPIENNNSDNLISVTEKGASLGTLWFTVNPSTVNKLNGTFSLVNSIDKEVPVKFETVKDNETVFKFGFGSRADENVNNGLYRAEAYIDPVNLDNVKINIEPGLKDALIDAVKNQTATDIAHMVKTIYSQLTNICDANALRYTWNSYDKNEDGTWNSKENKVYTNYGLAVTAFKPLSFHTLYGTSFKKLPHINNIELDKDDFKFDFGTVDLGDLKIELDLKFESVTINDVAQTMVKVKIPARYELVDGDAVLPDNWETGNEWSETNPSGTWKYVEFNIAEDLNQVVSEIRDAIDEWVYGSEDKKGFNQQIEEAVNSAVSSAFDGPNGFKTKIENQIKNIEGNIQDKVDDLVNMVNNDYLDKVNSLIGKVNNVSDRINKVLTDPNHYLQSMMMYKDANGSLHILSTDPTRPSQFKGNGEAIELFATTYNFETICPVFKKFVGVNKVTTVNGSANVDNLKKVANTADNSMATVIEGDRQRVVLDVKGATNGVYTYEIAYQALDYHGYTSTVKCYVQVIR